VLLLVLAGCGSKPQRLAVGWADYTRPVSRGSIASGQDASDAAQAVRAAATRAGLTTLLADNETGLLTYAKNDQRFANTAWVLNVSVTAAEGAGSLIRYRGFIFTSAPPQAAAQSGGQPFGGPKAFPSDGLIEREFRSALTAALGKGSSTSPGSTAGGSR
jgi:hypothetical protein